MANLPGTVWTRTRARCDHSFSHKCHCFKMIQLPTHWKPPNLLAIFKNVKWMHNLRKKIRITFVTFLKLGFLASSPFSEEILPLACLFLLLLPWKRHKWANEQIFTIYFNNINKRSSTNNWLKLTMQRFNILTCWLVP